MIHCVFSAKDQLFPTYMQILRVFQKKLWELLLFLYLNSKKLSRSTHNAREVLFYRPTLLFFIDKLESWLERLYAPMSCIPMISHNPPTGFTGKGLLCSLCASQKLF